MDAGSNALADSRPREEKGGESDRRSEEAKVMARTGCLRGKQRRDI